MHTLPVYSQTGQPTGETFALDLAKIADNIPGGRTICAFGEACSRPVQSFVAKFKDEFVAKGAADEARRNSGGTAAKIAASPE